ncbi:MAG: energy transducer TonB [Enterobacteriaceae bacterium]|nr:energy transducer TonB [Enterobacteriaceae bacterium]
MNRQYINRSGISLLTSLTLHGVILLAFLLVTEGESANSVVLQGKTAVLTIHMVSASAMTASQDAPVERQRSIITRNQDKQPPLAADERGKRQLAAEKPVNKAISRQKTPSTQDTTPKIPPAAITGESANQGKDRQESEEGIATPTTQQPMIGRGNDEKAIYGARLRAEIESHKRYPLRARQANISGVVSVRFTVEDDGRLTNLQLVSSSGNRDLDNAALEAVRQSNSIGSKPPGFGRNVSVNIRFNLRK